MFSNQTEFSIDDGWLFEKCLTKLTLCLKTETNSEKKQLEMSNPIITNVRIVYTQKCAF